MRSRLCLAVPGCLLGLQRRDTGTPHSIARSKTRRLGAIDLLALKQVFLSGSKKHKRTSFGQRWMRPNLAELQSLAKLVNDQSSYTEDLGKKVDSLTVSSEKGQKTNESGHQKSGTYG